MSKKSDKIKYLAYETEKMQERQRYQEDLAEKHHREALVEVLEGLTQLAEVGGLDGFIFQGITPKGKYIDIPYCTRDEAQFNALAMRINAIVYASMINDMIDEDDDYDDDDY